MSMVLCAVEKKMKKNISKREGSFFMLSFKAPFSVKNVIFRFCVGASFVTLSCSLSRGDDVASFLRAVFAQQQYPVSLLSSAFCALRLLFQEANLPLSSSSVVDCSVVSVKSDPRLRPSSELHAAIRQLESSPEGHTHLRQVASSCRAAREDVLSAREQQLRILQDSHSLAMSHVALRGDEPSEEMLADQRLQMAILEGKYVRELESLADAQRLEFQEFVLKFAAIDRETPVSQRLLANADIGPAPSPFQELIPEDKIEQLTSFQVLAAPHSNSKVCKISCVACYAAAFGKSVLCASNTVGGLVVATDLLAGSKAEKAFCEAVDELPELQFEMCSQQLRRARMENSNLMDGSVLITKHSNTAVFCLALHLLTSMPAEAPSLSQMRTKTRIVSASLRQCLTLCASIGCDTISVPLAFDGEERGDGVDDGALVERVTEIVSVAKEFLPNFRHVRFYVPPKMPLLTEIVKIIRTIKTTPIE